MDNAFSTATCTQAERDTYVSLVYYSPSEVDDMKASMTDDEKKAFDSFWNRYRYMDNIQKDEAAVFLDSIPNPSSTKNFDTLSKTEADGSKTYKYLYITEIVLVLSQNVDTSYCDASSLAKFNSDKAAMSSLGTEPTDQVTVKYTFGGSGSENQIKVDYSYKYMVKLNSSNYDSDILTKKLNYADAGGVPVPGCEAQIDAENDSMKIFLYFAENSMSYTDRGMVKLRNSYVLHDAK